MQFEMQSYNVKDFDLMTEYDEYIHTSPHMRRFRLFGKRIQELVTFNFKFDVVNHGGPGSHIMEMAIAYCKNWIAEDVINYIFKLLWMKF